MKKLPKRILWVLCAGAVLGWFAWRIVVPPVVAHTYPERREVVEVVVASGKWRSVRESPVGAETSGVVAEVNVREGDRVAQGDTLVVLRRAEIEALWRQRDQAIHVAEAFLRREEILLAGAVLDYNRSRELWERDQLPRAEYDAAQQRRQAAEASVQLAQAQWQEARSAVEVVAAEWARREATAPFPALVLNRLVEPGQAVSAGQVLLLLAELEDTEVFVETDENNLGKLALDQPATVIFPAFPDRPLRGFVTRIGPEVDASRGVVGVRLALEETPDWILPNMTVDVSVEVNRIKDALVLPPGVFVRGSGFTVLRIVNEDGRVEEQKVRLVTRNPDAIAVEGVSDQTPVLLEPEKSSPGRRVRLVTESTRRSGR